MSDAILTPEEALDWYAAKPDGSWDSLNDDARILNSHEALRSRLAEAEAERDDRERAAVMEGERRIAAVEAALAEAVELLRGTSYPALGPDLAAAVDRARAFIEAHGSPSAG